VLKRIFGFKKEEVTEEWRKIVLHEQVHNLYSSPYVSSTIKSRHMIGLGHVARMSEMRHAYKISAGKRVGKRPLGRYIHR
jgi:hypothetical protein